MLARVRDRSTAKANGEWPAAAKAVRDVIPQLRSLAVFQHNIDELPGRCKDIESELDREIDTAKRSDDGSDAIDDLQKFATERGEKIVRGFATTTERLAALRNDRSKVDDYRYSDEPWADVRSALSAAARTMYEYFETKRSETIGLHRMI